MELLTAQRSVYEIEKPLGNGLTSEVFKAFRKDSEGFTKQEVALKLIKSRNDVQILQKEFEALLRVNSNYCVQVLAWENFSKGPALVLEYIDGVTLDQLWRTGALLQEDLIEILCQIRLGLLSLHRCQVYHGDLNLKNVMVDKSGVVKLIDFGFGFAETQCLTPEFAAPERLAGAAPDSVTDWVSFEKLTEFLLGPSYCLKQIKKESPKGRRRRQLAKKVEHQRVEGGLKTRRWHKSPTVRSIDRPYLKIGCGLLFLVLLCWPNPKSHHGEFSELKIRSQRWFQFSLNGAPMRYGPVSGLKLRDGDYHLRWKRGLQQGLRAIKLNSDRTFLLNPEENNL